MKIPHWQKFDKRWLRFWRKRRGVPFNYQHVNGHCAFVAKLYCEWMQEGKERYGFFYGERTNPFWGNSPMVRHGWVEVGDLIFDPTRFCFLLDHPPMLAVSPARADDYDWGMNRFRGGTPQPEFDPDEELECDCEQIKVFFDNKVSLPQIFWMANLPPTDPAFDNYFQREQMFLWIQKHHPSFVPIDNRV